MAEGQIVIVKQDKVPALKDSEARLAQIDDDPYSLDTKPHGHGDVHHLLLKNGLTERWLAEDRRWIFFLQDTNALVVNSVLPALAVSASKVKKKMPCGPTMHDLTHHNVCMYPLTLHRAMT